MSQRNQKIGERKSDLICHKCEKELVWEGSILEGKMVCKNTLCIEGGHGFVTLSNDGYGTIGINDSQAVSPNIKINKILQRYHIDLYKGHRSWCTHTSIISQGICDCGYTQTCPHSDKLIETLERFNYGAVP